MKHNNKYYLFTSLLFVTLFFGSFAPQQMHEEGGIKWYSFEELNKLQQKKPRKIVVDVYTDWCGWCKKMDKSTFADKQVGEYVNKNYYAVKLDAESNKKILFNGKVMTERELASTIFAATGYPTTVYLDEELKVLTTVSSYLDIAMFTKIVKFFGDNAYKKQTWDQYNSTNN